MKKILFALAFLLAFSALEAQDIQLHYDMGKDRKYLTSTVEMFKPDQYGSTFFFIDMDYGANDVQGVSDNMLRGVLTKLTMPGFSVVTIPGTRLIIPRFLPYN